MRGKVVRRSCLLAAAAVSLPVALLSSTSASAQVAASAYTSGYRWDVLRRLVGKISPSSNGTTAPFVAERYTYDVDGQLTRTEKGYLSAWQAETVLPANWTGFTVVQQVDLQYDPVGNKKQETSSSGGTSYVVTQLSYDANDRPLCTTVRMNSAIFGALPSDACTLGTQGSQGADRITKNVYDIAGQLIQVRRAVGTGLEQAYATYSYTPNGKQEYVLDANGNRAKLEYDGYDRQVKWIFPSTTLPSAYNPSTQATALSTAGALNTADYEQYGYDNNGNRTSLRKRDGLQFTYTIDALNRVTVKVVPERAGLAATHTRDVYYAYDLLGRQLDARFDSLTGEGVHNVYDKPGRLTSTALTMDATTRTLSYQYDADGNRTQLTYPDSNYATYGYDGLDRPATIQRSGTSTIASYGYDNAGRRQTFNGGINTSYSYDPISRLATLTNNPAGNATYNNQYTLGYNPASQIATRSGSNNAFAWDSGAPLSRSYTPNGLNQYSAVAGNSYGYDANGNLTSDGVNGYTYDVENRLVGMSGSKTATLRYDPLGRLYEVVGSATTTRFLMGGDELAAEYDGTGTLLRRYVHGSDGTADDPVAWYEGNTFTGASERMLRPNWQGSVVLVTDNAGATIYARNTYDEYGYPGSTNAGRFQYTGQAWLQETGLYYYKARMYSPILGRFLQTDPIGYKDQINLYAYVGNDPVNRFDPTGLDEGCVAGHCEDLGNGDITVNGKKDGKSDAGASWFTVQSIFDIGRILDAEWSTEPQKEQTPACPQGPRANLGGGVSATGFLGLLGISGGLSVNVSVPTASLSNYSLRGIQFSFSGSVTPLAGVGVFLGAGPSYSAGGSNGALGNVSGSVTPVIQAGAGDGGGVEVSTDFSSPLSGGAAMGRIAGGAYGAVGARFAGTVATDPIGCR